MAYAAFFLVLLICVFGCCVNEDCRKTTEHFVEANEAKIKTVLSMSLKLFRFFGDPETLFQKTAAVYRFFPMNP